MAAIVHHAVAVTVVKERVQDPSQGQLRPWIMDLMTLVTLKQLFLLSNKQR